MVSPFFQKYDAIFPEFGLKKMEIYALGSRGSLSPNSKERPL
jgi:hypothetical protein